MLKKKRQQNGYKDHHLATFIAALGDPKKDYFHDIGGRILGILNATLLLKTRSIFNATLTLENEFNKNTNKYKIIYLYN